MRLTDTAEIGGLRRTRDGYLVADARVARAGIQVYAGREVGRPDLDEVRVWRPEDEVFDADAMASVAWRPVTVDHPPEGVAAANWRDYAVGFTGDGVARDGAFIRVPLTVMDGAAIETVAAGKRQLSLGYSCDLQFADGITPDGQAYDAIQKNIRINHLAICAAARAGPDCRLGDAKPGARPMKLKTILIDGEAVEVTPAAEAAVAKLKALLEAAAEQMSKLEAELGGKDAQIAELKGKAVGEDALDALAADRAAVLARAVAVAPGLRTAGLTNAQVRRAAVAARLGDSAVAGRSDDYLSGLFDHLAAEGAGDDALRAAIRDTQPALDLRSRAEAARLRRRETLARAWAA